MVTILRKKYSSRNHGYILVVQVTSLQLSQWTIRVKHILCLLSKGAATLIEKAMWASGASASAPWGRVVPEWAQRTGVRDVWGRLSSWFNVLILLFFEWRVSFSSNEAALLNYNWNLLKHCFFIFFFKRPFICILQHCLKWSKIWITKAGSVIYFPRPFSEWIVELVFHMSKHTTESSAKQCIIWELCRPFCIRRLCFVIFF